MTSGNGDYLDNVIEDKNPTFGDIEELEDMVDKKFRNFKNFAVVESVPYDHKFISRRSIMHVDQERIKLEWEVIKTCLPSSIYVRTYASRIDLMRIVIVGLEGTPLCHGLFFFDLHIPRNYPICPPEISYRGILGFNHDENISMRPWNLGNTGILQVLIWIQDRILNDKPCYLLRDFNHFKSMNEIFVLSCEGMIQTLRRRSRSSLLGFEDFVSGHFRKHAHAILLIYKNHIGKDELFFELVREFEGNGAYCQHHYDKRERRETEEEIAVEKSQCKVTINVERIIKNIASLLVYL